MCCNPGSQQCHPTGQRERVFTSATETLSIIADLKPHLEMEQIIGAGMRKGEGGVMSVKDNSKCVACLSQESEGLFSL